ncbi:M23 family metallopeptidase [Leucobacter sp. CSA1]|uniref:M23 family metallopeptidase n=1 Tax=Leucobacter chromiisoli TaxID=2796471 RepID=A0A934UWF9_9MICO|nr:peptidoglycan DD-metalloendopeptidase family protein [Leucobacter chromiisoli]MBK0420228.1 M23 family metallopeptidase [Leucobacter chromiisoli]
MSAPALAACAAAALTIGVTALSAVAQLEVRQRVAGAADAAALAASDAAAGWSDAEPCALAGETAAAARAHLVRCEVDAATAEARVIARAGTPFGAVEIRARAAPDADPVAVIAGTPGANGWAWPSGSRVVTQEFHDGMSIDLAVGPDGLLYAPYDGIVVHAGEDGGGIPQACRSNPGWWRGPNHTVVMRHEYEGRTLFSSHNHVAPSSSRALGVETGDRVLAGQAVASAGMSGCTSGPHTHFTLATHATNAFPDVNPYDYLGPP